MPAPGPDPSPPAMTENLVRTFRFALRLNAAGERAMTRELDTQRGLYNAAHQERRDAWL